MVERKVDGGRGGGGERGEDTGRLLQAMAGTCIIEC